MESIGEALRQMAAMRAQPSAKQTEIIQNCLEVARAWERGALPLAEAVRLCYDGQIRSHVTRYFLSAQDADAALWHSFMEANYQMITQDCANGGFDRDGHFLSILDITQHQGWVEREWDDERQELVCRAFFPYVNVDAPPRRDAFAGAASPYMAEWNE